MNKLDQDAESAKLAATLAEIKTQLAVEATSCNRSTADLRDTLLGFWENTGGDVGDIAQFVEAIDRERSLSAATHNRYRQLKKMAGSPYFGRIDFAEDYPPDQIAPDKIYIGISSLSDADTGDLLIYDWRSPVAGMFYDFGLGPASYQCAAGKISGALVLKRQYKINDGRLEYMFDSDLTIDDEMLREILGKSADGQMHTIVNSIQREQNQVIRCEGHRLLIVQGPAGSGKTSIVLHRVAFLLYRQRDKITAANILIFSPNHIFSDYISNVLPELGEENVCQATFQEYLNNYAATLGSQLESRSSQLEALLSHSSANHALRTSSVRYKSSPQFEAVILRYLAYLEKSWLDGYPDIIVRGRIVFSQADWHRYFHESLAFLPIARRLNKIRHIIQLRLRPAIQQIRSEKEAEITASSEEVNEKAIKALARIAAWKDLKPLATKVERLTEINPSVIYRRLFTDKDLFSRLTQGDQVPEEWPKIAAFTIKNLNSDLISYEDSIPFLYMHGMLTGFPARHDIKHLVVDEAQDYTTLQLRVMANLFPSASWTVLGDSAQIVHPCLCTPGLEAINDILEFESPVYFRLSRSYRSTREIQGFCLALLGSSDQLESVNRHGSPPEAIKVPRSDLRDAILNKITDLKQQDLRSIAVVVKTASEADFLYKELAEQTKLTLMNEEDGEFSRGVVIIPSYLVKGLEFDAVLVADASATVYGDTADRSLLYTVCTRALHRLTLFYDSEPSPFIQEINPSLYQVTSS